MNVKEIQSLKPGETVWDNETDGVNGLHLIATKTKKVFYFYYRMNGIQRRPKIGEYGSIGVPQARAIAKQMHFKIAQGIDPSLERQEKRAEPTLTNIFDDCWKDCWAKGNSAWKKEVKRIYAKDIQPHFGNRKLSDIRSRDISLWHGRIAHIPYTANRALKVLSRLFSYAESKELIPQNTNPCAIISAHKEMVRDRFATRIEIESIGGILKREFEKYPRQVAFICLLLLTGSRPSAIERAMRSDLEVLNVEGKDFGVIHFNGKTGREKIVLPPQALEIIFKLGFGTVGTLTHTTMRSVKTLWNKIKKEIGIKDLWLRDFRRTFATIGMSGGHGMALISELLNHKSSQTTMIYAKLTTDSRLKAVADIANSVGKLL